MIDEMVANLKKEQGDDDAKRAYCEKSFDTTDDKKKVLQQSISDSEVAIDEMEGSVAKLTEEIAALEAGIKELDKAVVEATEQRKTWCGQRTGSTNSTTQSSTSLPQRETLMR